jgi:hypothetical protein
MTCIAGVVYRRVVVIGADSAGVAGLDLTVRRDPKAFRKGEFIFGFTSSFRMGQLLAHAFVPPPLPKKRDQLPRYMTIDFVDALRACLKERGWATKQNEQEHAGTFLVGVRGRLFRIEGDYQVGEALDGYDAVGCGSDFARGALFATEGAGAITRVKVALAAAERGSAGVRGPFLLVTT